MTLLVFLLAVVIRTGIPGAFLIFVVFDRSADSTESRCSFERALGRDYWVDISYRVALKAESSSTFGPMQINCVTTVTPVLIIHCVAMLSDGSRKMIMIMLFVKSLSFTPTIVPKPACRC